MNRLFDSELPSAYSAQREWAVPAAAPLERYPHLAEAWSWSRDRIRQIGCCLRRAAPSFPQIITVAVSGSLGRLEAGPPSDCDLIVVLSDDRAIDQEHRSAIMRSLWSELGSMGLSRPNETGIYATPTTATHLCDPSSLGQVAQDMTVFGQRMQLLLDAQPVYAPSAYQSLVRYIVERYATGFLESGSHKQWVGLLNDLIRYFRSLCVWRQFDFSKQRGGWYTRNAKLRHSRILNYAGLLFLLGESSKHGGDKVDWLTDRLILTPLERIAWLYMANGDKHFCRIAEACNRFVGAFSDASLRAALADSAPRDVNELSQDVPEYQQLHTNSRRLMSELLRFVLARRGDWDDRFFEYMIF